jgi:hypothetical protein
MTGGFALIAWPALFASSGIMAFIVGPDGDVYQKDLGAERTIREAADPGWVCVVTGYHRKHAIRLLRPIGGEPPERKRAVHRRYG